MRVAVIGSHGTGKTTLSKILCERLSFNLIPDVVREAYKKKFPINENTPSETQFWVLTKQLELERNTETPWISEKSLFDNLVYGSLAIKDDQILGVLEKIVFNNANYDLLLYLPIEFSLEDDGLRSLDPKFQKRVDKEFRKLLKKKKIKFIEVKGSIEDRVSKALKHIKAHKKYRKLSRKKR